MSAVPITVPAVGESISEGIVSRWLKADGSAVQAGEPLLELETDKATTVVPSPGSGVLKIGAVEGETVAIGATVGTIDPSGVAAAAAGPSQPAAGKSAAERPNGQDARPGDSAPAAAPAAPPIRAAAIARSRRRSAGSWPRRTLTSAGSPAPVPAAGSPRGTCSNRWDRPRRRPRPHRRRRRPRPHPHPPRLRGRPRPGRRATHSRSPARQPPHRPHRPAPARRASG